MNRNGVSKSRFLIGSQTFHTLQYQFTKTPFIAEVYYRKQYKTAFLISNGPAGETINLPDPEISLDGKIDITIYKTRIYYTICTQTHFHTPNVLHFHLRKVHKLKMQVKYVIYVPVHVDRVYFELSSYFLCVYNARYLFLIHIYISRHVNVLPHIPILTVNNGSNLYLYYATRQSITIVIWSHLLSSLWQNVSKPQKFSQLRQEVSWKCKEFGWLHRNSERFQQ